MHIINKWKFGLGNPFASTAIVVLSAAICFLCGLSCFYNYRLHNTQEAPFPVCSFCPGWLFPIPDHTGLLEQQRLDAIKDAQLDFPSITPIDQNGIVIQHFEIEEPEDNENKGETKRGVPDLSLSDI